MNATLPLEVFIVAFDSHYYTTSQGRKKLKQVETEVQRLIGVRHINLLSIYAVKLTMPQSSGSPRLAILMEQRPSVTLHDVLEDSESLREDRALVHIPFLILSSTHVLYLV